MTASTGKPKRVLIIVENLPVPFDRRVWAEATTLVDAGYSVSVISPMFDGYEKQYELIEGVHVYRHPICEASDGAFGYLREYAGALMWQMRLALKIWRTRGFDVIHACNPPDLIFLVAMFFKLFGVKFVFDHHDLCPELFETKFERRGVFWRLLLVIERLTFALADVSIATNQSYKKIAIDRGRMKPERTFVVRSGPRLDRLEVRPPKAELKNGADILIGYVGVIGHQEGLDLLVDAIDVLRAHYSPAKIHVAVIGAGPALDEIKQLATARGLNDAFTFTGRASDDLMLDILNTADICVNCDRFSVMNDLSTMNKILEYMALAKPIVQFDLHEGRQSAGEASLYARPDDPEDFAAKIAHLIEHPDDRARMGALGRQRILDELSWRHSAPFLLAAYDAVFGVGETRDAKRGPQWSLVSDARGVSARRQTG